MNRVSTCETDFCFYRQRTFKRCFFDHENVVNTFDLNHRDSPNVNQVHLDHAEWTSCHKCYVATYCEVRNGKNLVQVCCSTCTYGRFSNWFWVTCCHSDICCLHIECVLLTVFISCFERHDGKDFFQVGNNFKVIWNRRFFSCFWVWCLVQEYLQWNSEDGTCFNFNCFVNFRTCYALQVTRCDQSHLNHAHYSSDLIVRSSFVVSSVDHFWNFGSLPWYFLTVQDEWHNQPLVGCFTKSFVYDKKRNQVWKVNDFKCFGSSCDFLSRFTYSWECLNHLRYGNCEDRNLYVQFVGFVRNYFIWVNSDEVPPHDCTSCWFWPRWCTCLSFHFDSHAKLTWFKCCDNCLCDYSYVRWVSYSHWVEFVVEQWKCTVASCTPPVEVRNAATPSGKDHHSDDSFC